MRARGSWRSDGAGPAGGPNGVAEETFIGTFAEDVFKGFLARERMRSERSNRPFALVVLGLKYGFGAGSSAALAEAIDALALARRETDIAGWLDPARIGIILPEISAADPSQACVAIEARFRRQFAARLDAETAAKLSIRFHVHPEPRRAGQAGWWPVEPLLYPELSQREVRGLGFDAIKRGLDVLVSLGLLLALSPLFLLIAALVKSGSQGPVLFRQVRVGRMMKPFTMLKFRSMYSNVDETVHRAYITSFIKAKAEGHGSGDGRFFKLTNDARITPIGWLLRKTSLDELPQLWNVLRGDMSLVGPRPPLPYEVEQYEPWHRNRILEATPGITGLWQVAGRSRTTFDEMVRLDVRYARRRSLWTDVKILLATPAAVVSGKGAC